LAGWKRRGTRRKKKTGRVIFILPPLFLILLLVAYVSWRGKSPEPKPGEQGVRLPVPRVEEPRKDDPPLKAEEKVRPPSGPKLALIIDDGGYNLEAVEEILRSSRPITLAILPHSLHGPKAALLAHKRGVEIMLHLPMEPKEGEPAPLEKNTVRVGMSAARVEEIVKEDLRLVAHVRGVNNHMGSKATEDPKVMAVLMAILKREKLYFVDSHTGKHSVGREVARNAGVSFALNDFFIDNQKELGAIKAVLLQAARKAKARGKAVAIGHPHPLTAQAIKEMIPAIEREGVRLVFASEVVK
jgi:polysaccharide deacetylase 2 family uncharacterized protein YibQ